MAKFICEFEGVRGRNLKLYDTKLVITTKKTVGSFLTGNITDGEKTIYLCDVVGVQMKKSGLLIGYLQFETPSLQMNNKSDNMFSENTFTYENGKNGITEDLITAIHKFITDRIEEIKYGTEIITEIPDFESMKEYKRNSKPRHNEQNSSEQQPQFFVCPKCGRPINLGDSSCQNCGQETNWNTTTTSNDPDNKSQSCEEKEEEENMFEPIITKSNKWMCPVCAREIAITEYKCKCGYILENN